MTSPVETVAIECPRCGHRYETQFRASINRQLDPSMNDAYVREMTTGTCLSCGHVAELGALLVSRDGVWKIT